MSQLREIELDFNEEVIKEVVSKMNGKMYYQERLTGFSTRNFEADIVIDINNRRFGIIHTEDGDKLIFDDFFKKEVLEFLKQYIMVLLNKSGFHYKIVENNREIKFIGGE